MPQDHMNSDDIKRKIRRLKKLEIKLRYPNVNNHNMIQSNLDTHNNINTTLIRLVWDEFFNSKEDCSKNVKYPIKKLILMNREEIRNVISEYFYHVYYRIYKESGQLDFSFYDSEILSQLGLPAYADLSEVKKKFRELAKLYHPDTGGDSEKFVELMETYKKLM